ncbi:hypothetical protein J0H58_32980 [bacterium]|nr:hypothetical protein [bacterium]
MMVHNWRGLVFWLVVLVLGAALIAGGHARFLVGGDGFLAALFLFGVVYLVLTVDWRRPTARSS